MSGAQLEPSLARIALLGLVVTLAVAAWSNYLVGYEMVSVAWLSVGLAMYADE